MHTPVPLVAKPGKSSRFRLWVTTLFFTLLGSSAAWAQTGLHYTPAEVAVWRQRANATATTGTTNYRIPGDVQLNSPGDWQRIFDCATDFNNYPVKYRYTLDTAVHYTGGCLPKDARLEPKPYVFPQGYTINGRSYHLFARGEGLMNAAFVDLVLGTNTYFANVKQELLWHANATSAPYLNFADSTVWCRSRPNVLFDQSPSFQVSEWMMRLLFAYDCYKGKFSAAEKTALDKWFGDAGVYFQNGLTSYYKDKFSDWGSGDSLITSGTINTEKNPVNLKYPMYYDINGNPSDSVGIFAQGYNNRMATTAGFVGTVGVFLKNTSLKASAKRFFIQWLRYGVYPSMDIADMSRAQQELAASTSTVIKIFPEKGYDYAVGYAFVMAHLADVFARDGDPSLYTYSTRHGYFKSQVIGSGTPKTLLGVLANLQKYMNGTHTRYGIHSIPGRIGIDTISNGNPNYRINGLNPAGIQIVGDITWDTWFSLANKYYRDATIKSNYLRQASGTRSYPAIAKGVGSNQPWGGNAAVLPGVLFMYGQMENAMAPYSKPAVITWNNPIAITYGTSLSSTQLNATANATGTFTYVPAAGSVLTAGVKSLIVNFAPADTFAFKATSDTVLITVNKAVPVISWATSAAIVSGTPLSATQLNATANVPGTFAYTPGAGTVLSAGVQTLSVLFTPTDLANYTPVSLTVQITVNACTASGSIVREYWANVTGSTIANIPLATTPTSTSSMSSFEGPPINPAIYGIGDNYAARYRGYLCAPVSGLYTFWIISDNEGEFFLSTDRQPSNKSMKAYIHGGNAYIGQWTKYPTQKSDTIRLVAGKSYYVEALHKEAGGGDILNIGWLLPTSAANATPVIIPGSVLSPYVAGSPRTSAENVADSERAGSRLSVFPNPSNGQVFIDFTTTATEQTSLTMYDRWGRLVRPLFAGTVEKGKTKRVELDGRQVATGLYIIRLATPSKTDFQKLVITK